MLVNAWNQEVEKTHQIDLERSQRSQVVRQLYQAVPTVYTSMYQ